MAEKNNTLTYRVGRLEEDVGEVKGDVKEILTNHLPHMAEDIAALKSRVAIFGTLILGAIGTLISLYLGGK